MKRRHAGAWLAHPEYLLVKRRSGALAALWIGARVTACAASIGAIAMPVLFLLWGVLRRTPSEQEPGWGKLLLAAAGAFTLCAATAALALALKAHVRKRAGSYDWSS